MDTQHPAGGVVLRFRPARPVAAACDCELRRAQRSHHDKLLRVETDFAEAVDLVDVATRWREGQCEDRWVHPGDWEMLAATHVWQDSAKVRVLFRLAADLALGFRVQAGGPASEPGTETGPQCPASRRISDEELIACEL